jgi:hypothetical protein
MENPIDFAFVDELWVPGLDRLQLDCDLFTCGHIGAQVDVTKRSTPNLPPQAVLPSDTQLHGWLPLDLPYNNKSSTRVVSAGVGVYVLV